MDVTALKVALPTVAIAVGSLLLTSLFDAASARPAQSLPSAAIEVKQIEPVDEVTVAEGMDQLTSVSQLTDVKPTDWAFQTLQSLVERYGCIVGYPESASHTLRERTFRGNQSLTRYEFAAGLNACLDKINELISANTTDLVKQSDLDALKKLQVEFAAELAAMRGRIDALEARTATLESQQFSTTTKLSGQIWFNLTGAFASDEVTAERRFAGNAFAAPVRNPVTLQPSRFQRDDPQITLGYYAFLNLTTSFTGKDSLFTQIVVGNSISPANQLVSAGFFNSWGTPFLDQTGTPVANDVVLRELSYTFSLFFSRATSYNSNGSTLSNAVDRGSGAAITWNISKQFKFSAAYLAENTEFLNPNVFNTSNNPADGLFEATNTISAELTFSPSSNFNLRFLYTRSRIKAYNGFIGGAVGEPLPYGYADDGFGGQVEDANADAFILNFDWLITPGFGIFGRYSYGSTEINPVTPGRRGGDVNVQSFQVGLGFPDLGKKGALGVISFVMPHDYLDGRRFLLSGGGDGGNQYDLEVSYFYPLTKNIAITPAFYAIFNANNFDSNPTVFVGNLRTQFSF